jgi:hypothetical protein
LIKTDGRRLSPVLSLTRELFLLPLREKPVLSDVEGVRMRGEYGNYKVQALGNSHKEAQEA